MTAIDQEKDADWTNFFLLLVWESGFLSLCVAKQTGDVESFWFKNKIIVLKE